MVGETLAFIGALFILLSAVGVVRLHGVLSRMHALSKASTLGIVLVLGGAALTLPEANDWTSLVLAMFLQLATSPVSATLISRSVYRNATRPVEPLN
jgi:multicomponent Na+:H+ antiporter subunit G